MNTFSVTNMGCLKLTYHTTGGSLDVTAENFLRVIGKKGQAEKKCIDYYPFGSSLPGRNYNQNEYDYGFGGHEKDDEVKGSSNHLSFGNYGYDPRIGRRWNVDPIKKDHESPYAAFGNSPIFLVDPSGQDTLVMHRSKAVDKYSSKGSIVYKVTFSVIRNGVETNLNKTMYMMGNAKYASEGKNGLPDDTYVLQWDQMTLHNGEEGWENTIRVTDFGVFIHPGSYDYSFQGCYGVTCEEPQVFRDLDTGEKTSTTAASQLKAK